LGGEIFCCCFHNHFFSPPPFLFFLGTILLVWTKQFHFTSPIPVLLFFNFFNIKIFDRRSRVPTSIDENSWRQDIVVPRQKTSGFGL
jgi:hypothetical protein